MRTHMRYRAPRYIEPAPEDFSPHRKRDGYQVMEMQIAIDPRGLLGFFVFRLQMDFLAS